MAERRQTDIRADIRADTRIDTPADTGADGPVRAGLSPRAPLGLAAHTLELREIENRALVTVVTADAPVRDRLERAFDGPLPAVGHSRVTATGERLLGLQHDRLYVAFDRPSDGADPERALRARLGDDDGTLLLGDQSDAWVTLRLDGAASRRALERVCPLDLHPDVFAVDAVARSVVEHLGVIVLRDGEDAFVLLSPRSSADSFLHEIRTSIRHVGGVPGA